MNAGGRTPAERRAAARWGAAAVLGTRAPSDDCLWEGSRPLTDGLLWARQRPLRFAAWLLYHRDRRNEAMLEAGRLGHIPPDDPVGDFAWKWAGRSPRSAIRLGHRLHAKKAGASVWDRYHVTVLNYHKYQATFWEWRRAGAKR